jgi:hypothetical protein
VLFWLYAPLFVIYMRNFAYLCITAWIHMDAHEYIYIYIYIYFFFFFFCFVCFLFVFQNLNILCIFWSTGFVIRFSFWFFSSSSLVPIFGVN